MKKYIKTAIIVACIVTAAATCKASAMDLNYNLNQAYDVYNTNGVVNSVYDIGSIMPYDDVRARTRADSTGGMSVTARAIITATDGQTKRIESNQKNVSGWVDSGWVQIDGQDYAKVVQHQAYRKFIATNALDKAYEYYIT